MSLDLVIERANIKLLFAACDWCAGPGLPAGCDQSARHSDRGWDIVEGHIAM